MDVEDQRLIEKEIDGYNSINNSKNLNENNCIKDWFYPSKYPWELKLWWRILHCTAYVFGGVTFLIGSICYLPSTSNYILGGWLFTWGSLAFLFADLFEWYTNNRVGCCNYGIDLKIIEEYELINKSKIDDVDGKNFFLSAIGSFLYLIGSILFIPSLNAMTLGTQIFIIGSTVIAISQAWKLSRYPDYTTDLPAIHVDSGAGIGGFFYLIGSIFFLPSLTGTNIGGLAAPLFVCGGACFFWSGLGIVYRYFIADPPMY